MARRYSVRGIAKDRVYDFKTAARIMGVSLATFRKYPERGLRVIADSRPKLVRGNDLINFLNAQADGRKQPGLPEQFHCMRCKAPRDALGGMADYVCQNGLTGRLLAFCAVCEGQCSKFSSPTKAADLKGKLEIVFNDAA